MSPDGKNVYVAGNGEVEVFARVTASGSTHGTLSQPATNIACFNANGTGTCQKARGLAMEVGSGDEVRISPDGKNVYVATGGALLAFQRNVSATGTYGALTQLAGLDGCLSADGTDGVTADGQTCRRHRGYATEVMAISPDGMNLYTGQAGANSIVLVLTRNVSSSGTYGALSEPAGSDGCLSDNGADAQGGTCGTGRAVIDATGIAISPDGKFVYTSDQGSLAVDVFARNLSGSGVWGSLKEVSGGCIVDETDPQATACTKVRALHQPVALSISPDPAGQNLYVSSRLDTAVGAEVELTRNASTGELSQPAGSAGCISTSGNDGESPVGTCASAHALLQPDHLGLAFSPDAQSLYATSGADVGATGALVIFNRDGTGALTQPSGTAGCHSDDGTDGSGTGSTGVCTNDRALATPGGVAVSPDDAADAYSASQSGVALFSRAQGKPNATNAAATAITQTAAHLNSLINPAGLDTHAYFQYAPGASGGTLTNVPASPGTGLGAGTGDQPFGTNVGSLVPNTTYHFHVVASNSAGTSTGTPDLTFKTLPNPPVVTNASPSSVTAGGAQLKGSINPNGATTAGHFEIAPGASGGTYSQVPLDQSPGSGTTAQPVTGTVNGLTPQRTYHFHLVASNAGGATTATPDVTFTTLPLPPTVTDVASSAIDQTSAKLSASVSPNSADTHAYFEIAPGTSGGSYSKVPAPPGNDLGSGASPTVETQTASGLQPDTSYHFHLVATNGGGTTTSTPDHTFRTLQPPVYVSKSTGFDVNPGTAANPKATLQAGVDQAANTGQTQIVIAGGQYAAGTGVFITHGPLTLSGGFNPNGWSRLGGSTTEIDGAPQAVLVNGADVTLDQVKLVAAPTPDSSTDYGVRANGGQLALVHVQTVPAAATGGASGSNGDNAPGPGANGVSGGRGARRGSTRGCGGGHSFGCNPTGCTQIFGQVISGTCDSSLPPSSPVVANGCNCPSPPITAALPGSPGGAGGDGGDQGAHSGDDGSPGSGPVTSDGGLGGLFGDPGSAGNRGQTPSSGGTPGTNGLGGGGGGGGTDGTPGQGGSGGGGGGGGGGYDAWIHGAGDGGGSGGSGGWGGGAGTAGQGGGSSFGVWLSNTPTVISGSDITAGNGGNGGNGGAGGAASAGGVGGPGSTYGTDNIGAGGDGGNGAVGGNGGSGGGGGGGASVAVLTVSGPPPMVDTATVTHAGSPGLPGISPAGGAANGAAGVAASCSPTCPAHKALQLGSGVFVQRGKFALAARCGQAKTCVGVLTIYQGALGSSGNAGAARRRSRRTVLARVHFRIAPGRVGLIHVTLNGRGRRLIRGHRRVGVLLHIQLAGPGHTSVPNSSLILRRRGKQSH